jgi:hypothetical protein
MAALTMGLLHERGDGRHRRREPQRHTRRAPEQAQRHRPLPRVSRPLQTAAAPYAAAPYACAAAAAAGVRREGGGGGGVRANAGAHGEEALEGADGNAVGEGRGEIVGEGEQELEAVGEARRHRLRRALRRQRRAVRTHEARGGGTNNKSGTEIHRDLRKGGSEGVPYRVVPELYPEAEEADDRSFREKRQRLGDGRRRQQLRGHGEGGRGGGAQRFVGSKRPRN